jgi:hypothetical protein
MSDYTTTPHKKQVFATTRQDKRIDFEIPLILKNSLKKQQGEHKSTVIFKKNA